MGGTCLGFQWIIEVIGGDSSMQIGHFDGEDQVGHLNFTTRSPGKMFARANTSLMHWFEGAGVVYYNHRDGIMPDRFKRNVHLTAMLDVLATDADKRDVPFVAAFEARTMPIYG